MIVVGDQPIAIDDGRILELLIHCLADTLNQRKSIISSLPLFKFHKIVTTCHAKMDSLVSLEEVDHSKHPLFSDWQVAKNKTALSISVAVTANLQHVKKNLTDTTDASFEVAAAADWIYGLSSSLNLTNDTAILTALSSSSTRKPRFMLRAMQRTIDVPDYANPIVPNPEHYKLARRDLAIVFKDIGAKEGKYELASAKVLIDTARDNFRELIHNRVSAFQRIDLVKFCIKQLDALIAKYDREQNQIQISLAHEVNYDRSERLAEAHEHFVKDSRNYRYLLECSFSMQSSGTNEVHIEAILHTVASIDWLMVLYNASDVLHNGLDVAGLELDHLFIPYVYYSDISDRNEKKFGKETANMKLGVGIKADDEVQAIRPSDPEWENIDQAFYKDTGVSLDKFLMSLHVLSRWPSVNDRKELSFSYSGSYEKVRDVLVGSVSNMTSKEAEIILSLISLNSKKIRRLLGKSNIEGDVPIWEHNKRGDRYTIKPIIKIEEGILTWGAASVDRAARIWQQTFANGYMPADYRWPNVKLAVRDFKSQLEKQLEITTKDVLLRGTPFTMHGIDFMRRFPEKGFDDVGDFDGLAYWPETNQWIIAECKYNQPAFCLKDARRLRDRIFGSSPSKGQFKKIVRRRKFLHEQMDQICVNLGWPIISDRLQPKVHELYISRDIYWWMRNPPYPVPTYFVPIDGLENWLRDKGLLK